MGLAAFNRARWLKQQAELEAQNKKCDCVKETEKVEETIAAQEVNQIPVEETISAEETPALDTIEEELEETEEAPVVSRRSRKN